MSIIPIRQYGDPVLREKSRELRQEEVDADFRRLIEDMGETMYDAEGIGLAANQIGETRRFFVADWEQVTGERRGRKRVRDPKRRHLVAFLNPEILEGSVEDAEYNEGCLSIPELEGEVFRPVRILVRYRTLDWELKEEWLDDLPARVFQHELDHLDGVLFVDRMPEAARTKLARELNRLKRQTESLLSTNSAG